MKKANLLKTIVRKYSMNYFDSCLMPSLYHRHIVNITVSSSFKSRYTTKHTDGIACCGKRLFHSSEKVLTREKEGCESDKSKRYSKVYGWDDVKNKQERMIRVDHAGEFGAVRICEGQRFVLRNDEVIEEIYEQEREHFAKFQDYVKERRVRPTLLQPFWNIAGFALGAGTAMLGREAAMACHKAVEEVIAQHYNDQLRDIISTKDKMECKEESFQHKQEEQMEKGEEVTLPHENAANKQDACDVQDLNELKQTIRKFRDEEMHHHDLAQENGAERAPIYNFIYNSVKFGCKTAIWLSTRI